MWLGQLHQPTLPHVEAGQDAWGGGTAPEGSSTAGEATPRHAPATPIQSGPKAVPLPDAAPPMIGPDEGQPAAEAAPSLSPLPHSGHTQPMAPQTTGPLTATAVPHLAAGIAATIRYRADGAAEIALSPEELGGVRLRIEADAQERDRVVVHLVFDRPETMDLFRRHADQLAEALRTAGYAEAKLDFGQAGTGAEAGHGQGSAQGADKVAASLAPDATGPGPAPGTPPSLRLAETAGLDLRL
jgi:hypothetical protein